MSIASRIQKETLKWTPEELSVIREFALRACIGLSAIETMTPDGIAKKSFEIAEGMLLEYKAQKERKTLIAATNPGM